MYKKSSVRLQCTLGTRQVSRNVYRYNDRDLRKSDTVILFSYDRLGISYPELTEMQVRAIFEAAVSLRNQGFTVLPEIMVPLVGTPEASLDVLLVVCFRDRKSVV